MEEGFTTNGGRLHHEWRKASPRMEGRLYHEW